MGCAFFSTWRLERADDLHRIAAQMRLDPAVCRRKYEIELEKLVAQKSVLEQRGLFVIGNPAFPTVDVLLVPKHPVVMSFPQQAQPIGMLMPGMLMRQAVIPNLAARAIRVRVDLSDFDIRAPSVTFLDAWTAKPIPYNELLRATNYEKQRGAHLVMLPDHPTTHLPFLCVRGVREYHEHPQHQGDDWMLYRANTGLFSVLMTVWRTCIDLLTPHLIALGEQIQVNWEVRNPKE